MKNISRRDFLGKTGKGLANVVLAGGLAGNTGCLNDEQSPYGKAHDVDYFYAGKEEYSNQENINSIIKITYEDGSLSENFWYADGSWNFVYPGEPLFEYFEQKYRENTVFGEEDSFTDESGAKISKNSKGEIDFYIVTLPGTDEEFLQHLPKDIHYIRPFDDAIIGSRIGYAFRSNGKDYWVNSRSSLIDPVREMKKLETRNLETIFSLYKNVKD